MMFFNLTSLQGNSYYAAINTIQSYRLDNYKVPLNRSLSTRVNLAYAFKIPDMLSDSRLAIAKKRFFRPSSSRQLFRSLWQQDIFLSINHKSLYKYNIDVNSRDILKQQRKQKSLLSKFSKALFSGAIQCSLTSSISISKKMPVIVDYSWSKTLRLQILKAQNLFTNNYDVTSLQSLLNNRINAKCLPIFTVSNNLGQMIISEPPRSFDGAKYIKESEHIIKKMYHGFFFINYEDAKEYLQYIQNKYNLNDEKLKIFACNLNTFYSIVGSFSKEISFRLIPDLHEISSLIKKNGYKNDLIFHKKQKKGRRNFQGQPLYFVKYSDGYLNHVVSYKKYTLLFTNYDEALNIVSLLQNNSSRSLLQKPQVVVYNLEKFMSDQLNKDENSKENFLILPSKSSYLFTKKYHLYSRNQLICNKCTESLSYATLWIKRVFWSLTSRRPV